MKPLTFKRFQALNSMRCLVAFDSCSSWELQDWVLAICGEAGELANLMKKIRRGDFEIADKAEEIFAELADIITYCDLALSYSGADTETVLRNKFREVSARQGFARDFDDDFVEENYLLREPE